MTDDENRIYGIAYELDDVPKDGDGFRELTDKYVDISLLKMVEDGAVEPTLRILKEGRLFTFIVPEGKNSLSTMFVSLAQAMKGSQAFLFITESWVVEGPKSVVEDYAYNPEKLKDVKDKRERLDFDANGFDLCYSGYIDINRSDDGSVLVGEKTILEKISHDDPLHGMNVTDLLLPMFGD